MHWTKTLLIRARETLEMDQLRKNLAGRRIELNWIEFNWCELNWIEWTYGDEDEVRCPKISQASSRARTSEKEQERARKS